MESVRACPRRPRRGHAPGLSCALALVLQIALAPVAGAEIYSWTDAAGEEHFTQDLNRVPPAYRAWAARAARREPTARINVTREAKATPAAASGQGAVAPLGPARDAAFEDLRGGRSQASWLQEHLDHLAAIARAQHEVEMIAASVSNSDEARSSGAALSGLGGTMISQARRAETRERNSRLHNAKRRLHQAEQAMAGFRERARRARVPEHWIREL